MHEQSGWKTETTGGAKKKTPTREVRGNSRADWVFSHARGTKGGHRRAFSGIWLRGLSPAGKVLTGTGCCSACGYAARSSLRSRRPSGPKTPIQYITLFSGC
jgi:hypothetical protein